MQKWALLAQIYTEVNTATEIALGNPGNKDTHTTISQVWFCNGLIPLIGQRAQKNKPLRHAYKITSYWAQTKLCVKPVLPCICPPKSTFLFCCLPRIPPHGLWLSLQHSHASACFWCSSSGTWERETEDLKETPCKVQTLLLPISNYPVELSYSNRTKRSLRTCSFPTWTRIPKISTSCRQEVSSTIDQSC